MGATVLAISVSALVLSGAAARGDALRLTRVAHFTAPVYATAAPGEPGNLYVVEQAGVIRVLDAPAASDRRRSSTSGRSS